MNTTHSSISEVSPGGLIGASDRQHYAAPPGHPMWVPRRHPVKYSAQSPLQKLLSMVEPIISPLSYEHSESDDVSQCTVNIEDIVSTPRLHNSFILYLTHTQQTARLRDFYFAIRCKEFKEWGDKVQYGPYRKQFLAKNIYQTFVKENGSNALSLSENVRRRVDKAMSECKLVPNMFDEVYRASLATLQQTVVKKFVESNYYQTIYNEMNCDLRSLTIGGNIRNKKASSLGSSGSSLSSSSSRPRHGLMEKFMSSCDSFSSGSEFQSLQSFSTNSSTSSTGSTYASTAHCKYYKVRNKTNTPPNNKEKNEKRKQQLNGVKGLFKNFAAELETGLKQGTPRVEVKKKGAPDASSESECQYASAMSGYTASRWLCDHEDDHPSPQGGACARHGHHRLIPVTAGVACRLRYIHGIIRVEHGE